MADSQVRVSGEKSGQTSYGIDRPLPCPGCGYDMRATPRESGRLACPECGGAWTQGQLLDHEIHPYISFGRVLLWTFTMPGVYSVMAVSSCCGCLTMASGAGSWLSEKLMWVGFWLIIGAGVLLMGLWNRGTAGRWASRMTRTPVKNGLRSGGWY